MSDTGFWEKLRRGLNRTRGEWLERVDAAVSGRGTFNFDEEILEHLEEALIAADLGVETTLELVANVRARATKAEAIDVVKLRQMLVDEMAILLLDAPRPAPAGDAPILTLIVGVNGAGKTTSAAKLARWSERRGEKALLAAADTFRAAAVEQLALWGERLGVGVIRQPTGSDAASVVFDAIQAAKARDVRHLIVDTAGRLHNKERLMAELAKIRRVIDREAEGFARRSLLVLDATTGQNAIAQAREFVRVAAIDGLLLAKLDGTAKGGMAVAVARELDLPVLFLGVGEGADDLIEFRPREFASALLG
jgi:fused signal recognition particle receptor